MASSDNVVRVGLTPKFKDIPALLDIMQFDPAPLAILATPSGDATLYPTPATEFSVSRLRPQSGIAYRVQTDSSPQMLIVTAGAITISWQDGSATYHRGQSIFIPAILPDYEVTAGDNAEYFCADIPSER
jgi:mannose-6-phosphate isomerase